MAAGANDRRDQIRDLMSMSTSSFTDLASRIQPDVLPWTRQVGPRPDLVEQVPHGTTVVAMRFDGGVIMAGDRQATSGTTVGYRYAEKVYSADEYSCVGIAGTASLAYEMARLFQVELLHYEKLEGVRLSLQAKANKLGAMVKQNITMAMQGFTVVPVYAGFDPEAGIGRIYSYDPLGGLTEEHEGFHSIGSGSLFATGCLKKMHRDDLSEQDAITVALEALYDAADTDIATMGPDLARGIYPLVHLVTAEGERELPTDEVAAVARQVVDGRQRQPNGPRADLDR
ncbi:proteasome subunit beta [Actinophytocola gossypii]|uniref:Proteasome subunit beta n=1 Tax=Actinophytocola gossypii TaxID=2812003 RepID=A0ABT2J1Z4_9PSEU|nr:proteasome subunit beta [Actinophytocola gossypii]MCT2581870.1 proteasome subunit beta [Actinophytocola gossypii]